jgi:glutathione gamma-glutamylcysteinyltransferase
MKSDYLGGYHEERDLVLIMDVARFKYPPYWVSLPLLFASMQTFDSDYEFSRGWMTLHKV